MLFALFFFLFFLLFFFQTGGSSGLFQPRAHGLNPGGVRPHGRRRRPRSWYFATFDFYFDGKAGDRDLLARPPPPPPTFVLFFYIRFWRQTMAHSLRLVLTPSSLFCRLGGGCMSRCSRFRLSDVNEMGPFYTHAFDMLFQVAW